MPAEESWNIATSWRGVGISRLWQGIHKILDVRRLTTSIRDARVKYTRAATPQSPAAWISKLRRPSRPSRPSPMRPILPCWMTPHGGGLLRRIRRRWMNRRWHRLKLGTGASCFAAKCTAREDARGSKRRRRSASGSGEAKGQPKEKERREERVAKRDEESKRKRDKDNDTHRGGWLGECK